jgi:hypothetical protein
MKALSTRGVYPCHETRKPVNVLLIDELPVPKEVVKISKIAGACYEAGTLAPKV